MGVYHDMTHSKKLLFIWQRKEERNEGNPEVPWSLFNKMTTLPLNVQCVSEGVRKTMLLRH